MLHIADADSAEHGTSSKNIVISPVACAFANHAPGSPKLFGADSISLLPGSRTQRIYGSLYATEEYFCNYEVNTAYEQRFRDAGLVISARGAGGEVRAIEVPDHVFFIATLFQPQLSSRASDHPLLAAFLHAAAVNQNSNKATA